MRISLRLSGLALLTVLSLSACDSAQNPAGPAMMRPVAGGYVSSGFGPRPIHPVKGTVVGGHHDGYDFAVPFGAPIHATLAGTVTYSGWLNGYGNAVIISHAGGWSTLYGHAETLKTKKGQHVAAGDIVALVGSTGISTGPHLHYELRHDEVPLDPGPYLDAGTTDGLTSTRHILTAQAIPHATKRGFHAYGKRKS